MRFIDRRRTRPVIPLVSLIDILTILLIFFIVTSEFRQEKEKSGDVPANERRLDIALPGVSEMAGNPVADQRVPIALTAAGEILLDNRAVANSEALVTALQARRAAEPEAAFELEPDERVPLGAVIKVWEALTKAGIPVADVPARVLKKD